MNWTDEPVFSLLSDYYMKSMSYGKVQSGKLSCGCHFSFEL